MRTVQIVRAAWFLVFDSAVFSNPHPPYRIMFPHHQVRGEGNVSTHFHTCASTDSAGSCTATTTRSRLSWPTFLCCTCPTCSTTTPRRMSSQTSPVSLSPDATLSTDPATPGTRCYALFGTDPVTACVPGGEVIKTAWSTRSAPLSATAFSYMVQYLPTHCYRMPDTDLRYCATRSTSPTARVSGVTATWPPSQ
eukprot:884786-Rhodomonas_salina.1